MNNKENKIWHIRRLIEFTFVAMVHLIPEMGFAQYFVGPVAAGSGGAGVAAAEPGEGALLNPAILSHAPDFSGSTFYRDGYVGEGHHLTQLGFMLVDNSKGVFLPGGLGFFRTRRFLPELGSIDENYYHLSFGGFIYRQLSLGVSALYLDQKAMSDTLSGERYRQWDAVVGLHYNPHPDWAVGFTYQQFLKPKDSILETLRLNPFWNLGMNYIVSDFVRLRAEVAHHEFNNPENKLDWKLGIESVVRQYWVLRFGGRWDNRTKIRTISMGFTIDGPRFKIDYAFVKSSDLREEALHSVDMRVPF